MQSHWTVLVPVKPLTIAKSRLRLTIEDSTNELALAFVRDTVTAALNCSNVALVTVVTRDDSIQAALPTGTRVIPEPHGDGLNFAIKHAMGALPNQPAAVITSDLPALLSQDLSAALKQADEYATGFVPDADNHGTVMLTAQAPQALEPRFGGASAAAHQAAGAVRLHGSWPSLRRDVDTADHLKHAASLGLGPHTAQLLAHAN